jgi:hypothetical protein
MQPRSIFRTFLPVIKEMAGRCWENEAENSKPDWATYKYNSYQKDASQLILLDKVPIKKNARK